MALYLLYVNMNDMNISFDFYMRILQSCIYKTTVKINAIYKNAIIFFMHFISLHFK